MTETQGVTPPRPLRLWPGIAVVVAILAVRYVAPLVLEGAGGLAVVAGMAGAALILLWWLLFSRAQWIERIGAVALTVLAAFVIRPFVHPSIAGGFMGYMLVVYALPMTLAPAFVVWAVATRSLSNTVRRVTMAAIIVLACGVWTLARTDGVKGEAEAQLAWRWTPTAEQRLLARAEDPPPAPRASAAPTVPEPAPAGGPARDATPVAAPAPTARATPEARPEAPADPAPRHAEWEGFRGRDRDSQVRGIRIDTDWSGHPPIELWRRPIGPGWSSFAVDGDLIYTQEQRGDDELVSCYRLGTGERVWDHRDAVRFYESNGGAGPRATPAVHQGRVYTLGATGIVNALDGRTGARLWSRDAQADTGATRPGWGFAGSPLIVDDAVIVAASGRLVAYDLASGTPRWTRQTAGGGYSSPQAVTIDGVAQILLLSGGGVTSILPSDGTVLWQHKDVDATNIVQPALVDGRDVLIAPGDAMGGLGIRRIAVARDGNSWSVQPRWTTRGLKPYYNDFVVHHGHAFGFDGTILACISLADGERKWKGGRYGAGQMLLLPEQDLLLVVSEDGDLALVSATPGEFTEVARFTAIEGKTWNHPVVVGDRLLVRNGEEMAAFRLPVSTR
jgi:outer membrane protein assembly factor BamB